MDLSLPLPLVKPAILDGQPALDGVPSLNTNSIPTGLEVPDTTAVSQLMTEGAVLYASSASTTRLMNYSTSSVSLCKTPHISDSEHSSSGPDFMCNMDIRQAVLFSGDSTPRLGSEVDPTEAVEATVRTPVLPVIADPYCAGQVTVGSSSSSLPAASYVQETCTAGQPQLCADSVVRTQSQPSAYDAIFGCPPRVPVSQDLAAPVASMVGGGQSTVATPTDSLSVSSIFTCVLSTGLTSNTTSPSAKDDRANTVSHYALSGAPLMSSSIIPTSYPAHSTPTYSTLETGPGQELLQTGNQSAMLQDINANVVVATSGTSDQTVGELMLQPALTAITTLGSEVSPVVVPSGLTDQVQAAGKQQSSSDGTPYSSSDNLLVAAANMSGIASLEDGTVVIQQPVSYIPSDELQDLNVSDMSQFLNNTGVNASLFHSLLDQLEGNESLKLSPNKSISFTRKQAPEAPVPSNTFMPNQDNPPTVAMLPDQPVETETVPQEYQQYLSANTRYTLEETVYALQDDNCSCGPGEAGEEVPIEQLFIRDGQMYRLTEVNIIRLGNADMVGFWKNNDYYISLILFFHTISLDIRKLYEKEIGDAAQVEIVTMGTNEFELLKQKCKLSPQTKYDDLISLTSIYELSKSVLKHNPQVGQPVRSLVQGPFYKKVLGNNARCTSCGLNVKKENVGDQYELVWKRETEQSDYSTVQENVTAKVRASVGSLSVSDETFFAFKIKESVYLSLKEIVRKKLFPIHVLKDRLRRIDVKPIRAPKEIEASFAKLQANVCDTLWIEVNALRCICCMSKLTLVRHRSDMVKCLASGKYQYEEIFVQMAEDTSEEDCVYTVDQLTLEIQSDEKTQPFKVDTTYTVSKRPGRSNRSEANETVVSPSDATAPQDEEAILIQASTEASMSAPEGNLSPVENVVSSTTKDCSTGSKPKRDSLKPAQVKKPQKRRNVRPSVEQKCARAMPAVAAKAKAVSKVSRETTRVGTGRTSVKQQEIQGLPQPVLNVPVTGTQLMVPDSSNLHTEIGISGVPSNSTVSSGVPSTSRSKTSHKPLGIVPQLSPTNISTGTDEPANCSQPVSSWTCGSGTEGPASTLPVVSGTSLQPGVYIVPDMPALRQVLVSQGKQVISRQGETVAAASHEQERQGVGLTQASSGSVNHSDNVATANTVKKTGNGRKKSNKKSQKNSGTSRTSGIVAVCVGVDSGLKAPKRGTSTSPSEIKSHKEGTNTGTSGLQNRTADISGQLLSGDAVSAGITTAGTGKPGVDTSQHTNTERLQDNNSVVTVPAQISENSGRYTTKEKNGKNSEFRGSELGKKLPRETQVDKGTVLQSPVTKKKEKESKSVPKSHCQTDTRPGKSPSSKTISPKQQFSPFKELGLDLSSPEGIERVQVSDLFESVEDPLADQGQSSVVKESRTPVAGSSKRKSRSPGKPSPNETSVCGMDSDMSTQPSPAIEKAGLKETRRRQGVRRKYSGGAPVRDGVDNDRKVSPRGKKVSQVQETSMQRVSAWLLSESSNDHPGTVESDSSGQLMRTPEKSSVHFGVSTQEKLNSNRHELTQEHSDEITDCVRESDKKKSKENGKDSCVDLDSSQTEGVSLRSETADNTDYQPSPVLNSMSPKVKKICSKVQNFSSPAESLHMLAAIAEAVDQDTESEATVSSQQQSCIIQARVDILKKELQSAGVDFEQLPLEEQERLLIKFEQAKEELFRNVEEHMKFSQCFGGDRELRTKIKFKPGADKGFPALFAPDAGERRKNFVISLSRFMAVHYWKQRAAVKASQTQTQDACHSDNVNTEDEDPVAAGDQEPKSESSTPTRRLRSRKRPAESSPTQTVPKRKRLPEQK